MADDICDIVTLSGKFKTYSDLHQYTNQQYLALQAAAEKISKLEAEVSSLQKQLNAPIQTDQNVSRIIVTAEEGICEQQINILQDRSFQRELTLEEIKKLDLLIKNKRLIKEQATMIPGDVKKPDPKNYSNAQLVQLASQVTKSEPTYES